MLLLLICFSCSIFCLCWPLQVIFFRIILTNTSRMLAKLSQVACNTKKYIFNPRIDLFSLSINLNKIKASWGKYEQFPLYQYIQYSEPITGTYQKCKKHNPRSNGPVSRAMVWSLHVRIYILHVSKLFFFKLIAVKIISIRRRIC